MRRNEQYERVEMDYKGVLDGCLKRVVALRYVIYAIAAVVAFRIFFRGADCLLNAPVESAIVLAVIILLSRLTGKPTIFAVVSASAALLFIYYPCQFVYIQSRILFFLFLILNIWLADKFLRLGRSVAFTSLVTALTWCFAMLATSILWPVTVNNSGSDVEIVPGVRRLDAKAPTVNLRGHHASSIAMSASGKYIVAAYGGDDELGGIAMIPVDRGGKVMFARIGRLGVRLQGIDSRNGNIYASDIADGFYYVIDPESLKVIEKKRIASTAFPFVFADSASAEVIVPELGRRNRGINVYRLGRFDRPWVTLSSGGVFDRMFPATNGSILPGVWSFDRVLPDYSSRKYFITNSISRYLLVIGMDDHKVRKIDTRPLPGACGAALDPEHDTLFMAKPLGRIEYYDTRQLAIKKSITGMHGVKTILFDKGRDMLIAADYYSGNLKFIDRESGETRFSRFLCSRITGLALSINGNVFASCPKGVYEINPSQFGLK